MKKLFRIYALALLGLFLVKDIAAQTPIVICPQLNSFTGMTRGYHFTANTTFTICGVYVEDDMSTLFQSVEIVRFTAGPPPAFAANTNNFVSLFYQPNWAPNTMIPVPNIVVNPGDIIGVYGSRGANSINSYGSPNCPVTINAIGHTLQRSGMQADLSAMPMQNIWSEVNYNIGRVTMYTNCCPTPTAIPAINGPTTVCEGDAVTYTVPAQTGAINYTWTVPAGATITGGQGTTSLNVTWNTAPGGQICVDWTDACSTSPQTCLNVTVNPTPTMTTPPNATYCPGDAVPPSAFVSNPAGGTFTWTNSNPAIGLGAGGAGNTPGFTATNPGTTPITGTITVTPTVNGCVGTPINYTITVSPTPTVTVPANATYCPGDAVAPSAFVSNPGGGTFTWTNSNTAIGLGASGNGNTPGFIATNPGATPITGTITVTPTANGCVGTPSNYTITVNPTPPAPTATNVTICPNNSATLTATAPGGNYEWYDAAVGGNLLGTGASYTTPILVANTSYWVQTTVNGCVSPRTQVDVIIAPALIVNAGVDDTICNGASYTLGVNPNGPGYTYVWDELPGPLGFSTVFNPTVSPTVTTTYVVTVTDANNCVGDDSVTIYVNPTPTMTAPANITACNGDAIPASAFTSNPAGGTFAWTNSDPTIGLAASGTGNTPGFNATNTGTTPVTATITVTPTVNGCVGTPVQYTITVNPTPTMTAPANATYCDGDAVPASAFTTTPAGGTFTWTNSDPTIGLAANGTGNTPGFTATNAGTTPVTATITVTPTVNGCVGAPVNYTITVNPTPTMTAPANITVCNGDPIAASNFTSTPGGGTFDWTNTDPTIGLGANGTGNTPAFTAINNGSAPVTATITITPTVNGCVGAPVTYTITVNPGAVANVPGNITVCDGDQVPASAFTSTPAGGTFAWTNSNTGIGLGANGTGNTPGFTATNTGGSPITGTISVTATANGCPGPAATYTITVNPTVFGTSNVSICQGDSILIGGTYYNAAGSYVDTLATPFGCDSIVTYNVTVNIVSVATTNITICNGDSVLIDGNYYSAAGNYPFTYTSAAGCDSIVIYAIAVDSVPYLNVLADETFINLGESVNLTAYTGQPNTSYYWTPPIGLSCQPCPAPIATPPTSMWYYVTATNANGCTRMDSVYIEVDPTTNLYIPNIFSPNDDGNNDVYYVRGKGIELFYLAVFNRWGQMVFESNDINKGWDGTKDGTMLNQGVFVYKVNVTMYNGDEYKKTGNITLVR